jgi:hypothetical protein
LWQNVKKDIQISENSAIIFDDTVLDKRFGEKIELVRRQYSGTEHRVLSGIGLVNCVYVNPELGLFWVIDYCIAESLSSYLIKELNCPSIKMELV